jgi:hypothetical protein
MGPDFSGPFFVFKGYEITAPDSIEVFILRGDIAIEPADALEPSFSAEDELGLSL